MSERREARRKRTVWDEARAKKALMLRAQEMTYQQIADEMRTDYNCVAGFFNRLKRDKNFYIADERERRQVVRKERMVVALAQKPRVPIKYNGELVAKIDDALPPMHMARIHLGKRLKDTDKALYLDGREVGVNDVMMATNSLLSAQGLPQVLNNPAWRVGE